MRIDGGAVIATVTIPAAGDHAAVRSALGAYAVRWDLRLTSPEEMS